MVKLIKNAVFNLRSNFYRIAFEGIGMTVILLLVSVILFSNILRVFQKGQNNFSIYKLEKQSLEELKEKNAELKEEQQISSSEEYLLLKARDILGLGKESESLYKIKPNVEFYETKKELLELSEKENYSDWWESLIR